MTSSGPEGEPEKLLKEFQARRGGEGEKKGGRETEAELQEKAVWHSSHQPVARQGESWGDKCHDFYILLRLGNMGGGTILLQCVKRI